MSDLAVEEAREVLRVWGDDPSGYGYCSLAQHIIAMSECAGMCPVCDEWAGRGRGCEWCSEFAEESGWNSAAVPVERGEE